MSISRKIDVVIHCSNKIVSWNPPWRNIWTAFWN